MASQTPPGAGSPGQPSEEEMRAYLAQLREADPAEIVAQAYTMLGTGAEVKLGRPDARTLIDGLGGLVEAVASRLPSDLVDRMRNGVTQLQMAQVDAERSAGAGDRAEQAQQAAEGRREPETGPRGQAAAGSPGRESAGGDSRMTDRLWIPGRDPRPR